MSAPGTIPHTPEELLQARQVAAARGMTVASGVMKMALDVLADRVLLWASFGGSVGLFTFAILEPTVLREVIASTYTVLVMTPQLFLWHRKGG